MINEFNGQPFHIALARPSGSFEFTYAEIGLGTTIWSPLASGLLTGKYAKGVPADSRGSLKSMAWMHESLLDPAKNAIVAKLGLIAQELGCTTAQLAIAWCLKNPNVSTVITGASRIEQVGENMKSLAVVAQLTPEVMTQIHAVFGDESK